MNTLYLLRHAKSSWDDAGLDDFDRRLAKRGRKTAPLIGKYMAERGWQPDLALVSPAVRTRETWDLVSAELPAPVETRFEPAIYMAEPDDLLALLGAAPDEPRSVILIGHNPGLEQCAAMLASQGSDPAALARIAEKFPTAALARFEVPAALEPGDAVLTDFVTPKDLAS